MSEPSYNYCMNCGTRLPEDRGSRFCPICGQPIHHELVRHSHSQTQFVGDTSTYQTFPDRALRFPEEPRGPLFQRFINVLIAPPTGMRMVTRAPDFLGPLIISSIIGGFSAVLYFFLNFSLGSFYGQPVSSSSSYYLFSFLYSSVAFFSQIIGLFIWAFIFWIVLGVFTTLQDGDRKFRRAFSIVGYAWLPNVVLQIISILYYFFAFSIYPPNMSFSMAIFLISLPLTILSYLFTLWSIVLLYFALNSLEVSGDRAIIICGGYLAVTTISLLYSFIPLLLLSMFL
ncbi:MAG: YIP1 family protein [Candidatus Hodarchaeota archaeon]